MSQRFTFFIAVLTFGFVGAVLLIRSGHDVALYLPPTPASVSIPVATSSRPHPQNSVASSTVQTNATVVRVVDGDTFEARLDGDGDWKIRMLGINTPESVDPRRSVECFGKEASAHAKQILEGKRVRLEADPRADERDKYGRLLRNVYLEDGTDVNAEEVRDGFAYAYLSFPLTPARKQQLRTLEAEARVGERGLWSPTTCRGMKSL